MDLDIDACIVAYGAMRDKKRDLDAAHKAEIADLDAQMDVIKAELLKFCEANGTTKGGSEAGSFTRGVKTRWFASDWEAFHKYVMETGRVDLLEKRIAQGTATELAAELEKSGEVIPGTYANSEYTITVRVK